MKRKKRNI